MVGFKSPNAARGVYKGRILVTSSEIVQARGVLAALRGSTIVRSDELLPRVKVKLADRDALTSLRRLPFIDYIEPARSSTGFPSAWASNPGCGWDTWSGSIAYYGADIIPEGLQLMKFPQAWTRTAGEGVTIGLTDTGLYGTQSEINTAFASGESAGRSLEEWYMYQGWAYPTTASSGGCSHGTRLAGLMAAPKNGQSVIGGAWRANLVSVHQSDQLAYVDGDDAAGAIRASVQRGAKIVNMAWQSMDGMWTVSDEIEYWYANSQTLFVGAAGSSECGDGIVDANVVFPAELDEVVAVAAIPLGGGWPTCGNHYGPEVDVTAYDTYLSLGQYPGEISSVAKSSSASAVISSIAALIWARYPTWTRTQVRNRLLYATAYKGNPMDRVGHGLANAWGAVGGFWDMVMHGPTTPAPETPTYYTYSAQAWGGGPGYSYLWSTGETTESIQLLINPVDNYTTHHYIWVTVTDLSDGTSMTSHNDINPRPYVSGCPDCFIPPGS